MFITLSPEATKIEVSPVDIASMAYVRKLCAAVTRYHENKPLADACKVIAEGIDEATKLFGMPVGT